MGFVEKEFRNIRAEGLERQWIAVPSTAALAWIPYDGSADAMGDSPLRERYERDLAVRLLFASGNPEPQAEFPGDVRFADRLGLGDFRAAIALRRPRLAINAQRQPVALRVGTLYRMGRTPIPFGRDRIQVQLAGREQAPGAGCLMPHTFCHDRALRFGNGFALGQTSLGYDGRFFLRGYSLAWAM